MKFLLFEFLLCWNIICLNGAYFRCDPNRPCGCGRKQVEINTNRIINGEEAIPSSWSMIVSIRFDFFHDGNIFRHACGGTILTDWYILTSASCLELVIENIQTANVTIAAGVHRRSQPRQIIRDVDDVIIHPNWTGSAWTSDYDIALLHLSEPLEIVGNPLLTRTCISSQIDDREELLNYPPTNTTLAVVGWGRIISHGDDSDALRQMIVAATDPTNQKCMQIIPDASRQLCASAHLDSIGPCYGDFGGPIFQWKDTHWEQIGIASSTLDGCRKTTVVSYTRLAFFRNWIDENLQNSNDTIEEIPVTAPVPTTTEKPIRIYQCDRNTVPCGCGRRSVRSSPRDSTESVPHSWSTIVSIRLNNQTKHSCTGTILSESFILTSASCLVNTSVFGITILASVHNSSEENPFVRRVDRIYFHPNYQGFRVNQNQHDIAILHLNEELIYENNFFLNRICLPQKLDYLPDSNYYPQPGASLITVGWGLMSCQRNNQQD